jgi:hypothetical protein
LARRNSKHRGKHLAEPSEILRHDQSDPDEIRDLAAFLYDLIESQITRADTKAGLILAADTVFATTLIILSKGALPNLLSNSASVANRFSALLALLTFVALLVSSLFVLLVARPIMQEENAVSGTLFFFGKISRLSHKDFVEQFSTQSSAELRNALLTEVYMTARLANDKFTRIRYSLDFLIIAVLLWAMMQVMVAVGN